MRVANQVGPPHRGYPSETGNAGEGAAPSPGSLTKEDKPRTWKCWGTGDSGFGPGTISHLLRDPHKFLTLSGLQLLCLF